MASETHGILLPKSLGRHNNLTICNLNIAPKQPQSEIIHGRTQLQREKKKTQLIHTASSKTGS